MNATAVMMIIHHKAPTPPPFVFRVIINVKQDCFLVFLYASEIIIYQGGEDICLCISVGFFLSPSQMK